VASDLTMDSADFITLADQTANDASEVDDNFTQVITDFNTFANDHDHDGTNSSKLVWALSPKELLRAQIMGSFT